MKLYYFHDFFLLLFPCDLKNKNNRQIRKRKQLAYSEVKNIQHQILKSIKFSKNALPEDRYKFLYEYDTAQLNKTFDETISSKTVAM